MNRIDGIPTEFKWKIFPRITTLGLLEESQRLMTDLQCEPEDFTDKIIFMSMYNDIEWKAIRNKERKTSHWQLQIMLANSLAVIGLSCLHWPTRRMMDKFLRIWSPNISSFQCLWERELRSNGGSTKSIHFNGSHENIKLPHRTVISANQSSIYGAIADLCNEVPKDFGARRNPAAPNHLDTMEILTDLSIAENIYQCTATGKPSARIRAKIRTIVRNPSKKQHFVLMRVWSLSNKDNTSILLTQKKDKRCNTYAENVRCFAMKKDSYRRMDGFSRKRESAQSWTWKFAIMMIDTVLKFKFHLCFKTIPFLEVSIVNGVDKYVTESMLTTEEEDTASANTIAKQDQGRSPQ